MKQGKNIQRLEFHISYQCINNCLFCSEREQLDKFKGQFVEKEKIEKKLSQFAKKGFNHVTFTGGEPTLHPNFIEILQSAKELNYINYVTSNGNFFDSKRLCQKAAPYLNEICLSIHGHNARLHNFHTRNKKSFARLMKSMENMQNSPRNIYGFANIVITKYNFDSLEKIVEFISRYPWIKQVLFSNLAPEGNALRNFKKLAVPLGKIENKINNLANLALKKSLNIRFFGLPLCLMGNHQPLSNDIHWSARATIEKWGDKKTYLKTTFSYQPTRKRIKTIKCKNCQAKEICGGIFKKYCHEFSDRELKPIQ